MSVRPIDEDDCIICGSVCESVFYCKQCDEEIHWENKCYALERKLAKAREDQQYSDLEREWLLNIQQKIWPWYSKEEIKCLMANEIEKQLKEKG